jgi:hypothetical protein
MVWNGNEFGQDKVHEIPKTTIPTRDYNRSKKTEEYGTFQQFVLLVAVLTREIEPRIRNKSWIQQEQSAFCLKSLT